MNTEYPLLMSYLSDPLLRKQCMDQLVCMPAPIGCGKEIVLTDIENVDEFKDYKESGLCADCRYVVLGKRPSMKHKTGKLYPEKT